MSRRPSCWSCERCRPFCSDVHRLVKCHRDIPSPFAIECQFGFRGLSPAALIVFGAMWAATFIGSWASDSFLNLQGNSYLDRLNFFPSSLPSVRRSILAQT